MTSWRPIVTDEEWSAHQAAQWATKTDEQIQSVGSSGWDLNAEQQIQSISFLPTGGVGEDPDRLSAPLPAQSWAERADQQIQGLTSGLYDSPAATGIGTPTNTTVRTPDPALPPVRTQEPEPPIQAPYQDYGAQEATAGIEEPVTRFKSEEGPEGDLFDDAWAVRRASAEAGGRYREESIARRTEQFRQFGFPDPEKMARLDYDLIANADVPAAAVIKGIGPTARALQNAARAAGRVDQPAIAAGVRAAAGESVAEASRVGQIANITEAKFDQSLQPIIREAANRLAPEAVDVARRGEIPEETLRSLAGKVGLTTEQFIRRARPGKAYSGEEILALDEAMATTAREIRDLSRQMADDPAQITDAMRAEFGALSLQATGLAKAAVGARAEAGRALNAMRYLRGASDTPTRLRRAVEMIGDAAENPDTMRKIADAADDPVELFGLIRDMQKPNFWDRFGTYYRANLLSSPLTQVRNIAGNAGALVFILPERAASAAVDAARAAVTRGPRERFFGEVNAQAEGMFAGFGTAVRRAGEVLSRGYTAEDALKLEQAGRYRPFGMGKVGTVVEAPFRALSAGDAFFRTLAESGELWTLSYRQAAREGLKGAALRGRAIEVAANPTPAMIEQVAQAGAYRTYTQTLDQYGQAIANIARKPGMEFFAPFVSTPWNIAKFELERTPVGLLSVGKAIADKKGAGEVADRAGRMLLGSGIGASLYGYALGGNMTSKAPENPTERDLFYREGKQPFSIRIGDSWHSYAQFTGLSSVMALTAATAEANRRLGTAPTEREAMRIVAEAASVITEKPFLQGFKSLQEAMESPDKAVRILENSARGLVPASSLLGGAARAIDPTMREAEGVVERVQSGIPGLSQQLPARLDAFGNEVRRDQSGAETLLNPIARTAAKYDPVDEELRRLISETGDAVGPSIIGRTAKIAGQELDRGQRRHLKEEYGPEAYEALLRLFSTGEYLRAKSDEERKRLVTREVSKARERAGERVLPKWQRG